MVQGACNSQETLQIDQSLHWNRMQYYGGENTCVKQQDGICQEGQVISCLADSASRADRRGIVVEPRLLNLTEHKQIAGTK